MSGLAWLYSSAGLATDKPICVQFTCSGGDQMGRRFDHLNDVEALLAAVEHGSITAGAAALAITPSALSRAVTRLEARLGCQLLRRSTRKIAVTDVGRGYLEQARAAFSLIDDAERAIPGQDGDLTGRVRLSAPTSYGHHRLPPLLARFTMLHPQVRIELNISNRNVDLVAEGFDLAIRLGHLPDSALVARKLEDAALVLVAAPEYLARAGAPRTVDDLRRHLCLPFVMPRTGRVAPWLFRDGVRDVNWTPPARIEVSDDVLGVVSLAERGVGICQSYDFIVRARIARGDLVELLPRFGGRSRPFSLVYARHRRQPAAVRALIAALTRRGDDR